MDIYIHNKKKLFCTFVDYKTAFDKINRAKLWEKLVSEKHRVNGKIYRVIYNLYKSTRSCVLKDNKLTEFFDCNLGVRQGENLSPSLFSIYLSNLIDKFKTKHCGLPLLENLMTSNTRDDVICLCSFFLLLYADDTALLAESENDMQQALDILEVYCKDNSVAVNTTKTKVIVFSHGKIRNVPKFKFGNNKLDVVDQYPYLGVIFNYNGKFLKQIDKCSNKGHFSMYKLLKSTRQLALPTDLSSKLFDSVVSPVMTYGSEVWGNVDVTELESVHLKLCKYILGTNKFTTNVMIYGELGRHPINIEITGKILNFWASMTQNVCYKMSVIMYNVLYNLYVKNIYKSPWIEFVKRKLDELGLSYMWVNQNVGDYNQFKSLIKQRMLDQHLQTWKSKVDASSKCTFYRSIKISFELEKYLTSLPKTLQQSVTRFRVSNHKLPVELLRHSGMPREKRLCNKCEKQELGDEIHYIYHCSFFKQQRKE